MWFCVFFQNILHLSEIMQYLSFYFKCKLPLVASGCRIGQRSSRTRLLLCAILPLCSHSVCTSPVTRSRFASLFLPPSPAKLLPFLKRCGLGLGRYLPARKERWLLALVSWESPPSGSCPEDLALCQSQLYLYHC